ncbi:MAG TPA: glutathione S-transferase family protein [Beijerinckiaceae bacterium]|jgi:glutathione S-transferase|nr:glutathione S-transferase family protein [Beijerinckiaceae bacterium]
MLVLRSSGASPFVRKVRIAADLLGFTDRIRVVEADTLNPAPDLLGQNPLGKIPTLVLETGEALYDSRVILEYLDALAGGGKIIPPGWSRFEALRLQALADGIMDSGVLQMYEIRWRPEEHRVQKWVDHQKAKVERALAIAEASHAKAGVPLDVGSIALACALGYLDLRFEGRWRQSHPRLVAWLDDFAKRVPAFEKTRLA